MAVARQWTARLRLDSIGGLSIRIARPCVRHLTQIGRASCRARVLVESATLAISRSRHTRWPRDWSSDVCSSDLIIAVAVTALAVRRGSVKGRYGTWNRYLV